jgi:hypothetical protein
MSLVSGSIPNFISGVSQQAFAMRLASQADVQVNGWPSVVTGLDKRPPFEHGAILNGTYDDSAFIHLINRDAVEQYVVVVAGGDLRVFRMADGSEVSVSFPHGKAYLSGDRFSAVTIADFTFLVNRDVVTAMDTSVTAPSRNPEALVAVRVGNYSTTYNVTLSIPGDTRTATYTTSNTDAATIRTDHIANELANIINGWGNGFVANRIGSTLHIYRSNNGDFTISSSDSYGDQGILVVKGKVAAAELLPAKAVNGFIVEVEGAPGNRFDNRWLRYKDTDTASGSGVWVEVPKPGRRIRFNAATMPHVLVREADGTFTFRRAQWADCRCGDENVSPEPGWIGLPISDVFFYRNRLGFVAGEQIGLSRNGEFFNFWRETAQQILDTDPIDVAVSHVKVSNLHWAVPFNETLLLFSNQTQFIDNSGGVLSPVTVDFRQVTEFEASVTTRPKGIGPFIYFGANRGAYSSVREYYLEGSSRAANANDITAHVPELIRGNITDMAASPTEDCLAVVTDQSPGTIWIYKFQFAGAEKVQSAWTVWDLGYGARVLGLEFINSSLWAVILRGSELALERVDLDPGRGLGDLPFVPKLDRLILGARAASVTYNASTDRTSFNLGFDMHRNGPGTDPATLEAVLISPMHGLPAGHRFVLTDAPGAPGSPTTVTLPGNWTSTAAKNAVVFGRRYELRHRFSPIFVRAEAPGGGLVAITDGRLQLSTMRVNYTDTGYFVAEVTPFRRSTYRVPFTGRVVGSARNLTGRLSLETGTFSFPIRARNLDVTIDLVNDSPYPSRFLNAEWEGVYTPRGKRVD